MSEKDRIIDEAVDTKHYTHALLAEIEQEDRRYERRDNKSRKPKRDGRDSKTEVVRAARRSSPRHNW